MTAANWTADELDRISRAEELEIGPQRRDGSSRRPLPIWVVRVADDLFVRSWRGAGGGWYRAAEATHQAHISAGGVDKNVTLSHAGDDVNDAVDAAYRTKYGRHSAHVGPMVAPQARATTLKLVPDDPAARSSPPNG
jgi:hypothetical protein